MKPCLYEVLGVSQTATADELRAAYKKLVMIWHPDKNLHRAEEATARFKEIQNAYDTLNDSNERAWYDSHRDPPIQTKDAAPKDPGKKSTSKDKPDATAPLKEPGVKTSSNGKPGPSRSSSTRIRRSASSASSGKRPEEINLWPYFAPDAFSGSGDSGKGFFKVYKEIFDLLNKQELESIRRQARVSRPEPPPLGNMNSSWETVKAFYEYWTTFYTVKDYAWFDEYDPTSAPDDRLRKWMERENDKIRQRHKEEFETKVRRLASHARKKDPRVVLRKELKAAQREAQRQLKQEKAKDPAKPEEGKSETNGPVFTPLMTSLSSLKFARLSASAPLLTRSTPDLARPAAPATAVPDATRVEGKA